MLFKEKEYKDAIKRIAKNPAKFSSFLTDFAIDVRNEMAEDDREVFDFYILTVFPGAVTSGGDPKVLATILTESLEMILPHCDKEDGDEAEHKQD